MSKNLVEILSEVLKRVKQNPSEQIPDFFENTSTRILMDHNGNIQELPTPLVMQSADYVLSVRVSESDRSVLGAVQVPCVHCSELCWRSPSSPSRIKLICMQCATKQQEKQNEN